ncbi:MAG: FitA-like ribbon-helix-helix domain-containing protein [Bryobacteraceae bacterium]
MQLDASCMFAPDYCTFRAVPSLRVRDLPEAIYRRLVERARQEHRTIAQQATVLLARALDTQSTPRERRNLLLKQLRARPLVRDPARLPAPDTLVREDRQR